MKILVLNLRGNIIGDSIKESCLFEYLKREYPKSYLVTTGGTVIKQLHENNPHIDTFIELKALNKLNKNISRIKKALITLSLIFKLYKRFKDCDICILTQNHLYPYMLLPKLAKINKIKTKQNLPLNNIPPKMYFSKSEESKIKEKYSLEKNKIVSIQLDASHPKKNILKKMARQIIDVLIKNNFSVFILGSSVAKEEQFNEANVNDLRGTTSIREAAIIIKNSSFCLANDSGLANIAAAVNTNLICLLYGPDTDILNDPKKSKANIIRNPSLSKIITAIERFMNPKNSKPRAI